MKEFEDLKYLVDRLYKYPSDRLYNQVMLAIDAMNEQSKQIAMMTMELMEKQK